MTEPKREPKRQHRRYTNAKKAATVILAEQTSMRAASEATGVPLTTIDYWMDRPRFVALRTRAREEMADEALVVARVGWGLLAERMAQMEDRDLINVTEMATSKTQLLSGGPTVRTETRSLGDDLSDDEKQRLRDWIDALPATADVPEGDPA